MQNCRDCILCNDLENASYCIRNQQLDKEEYLLQKEIILKDKNQFSLWYTDIIPTIGKHIACTNTQGNFLMNSENIVNGNMSFNVKN